jgi:uncharacterized membrane protein
MNPRQSGWSGAWARVDDVRRPDLRIGDTEREAAASALGEHYAAGRLTQEEFDERSARVYAARTNAELWPMFRDLPPTGKEPWAPTAPARTQRDRGRHGFLMPALLVAVGLVVLLHIPWVLLLVLVGCLLWSRSWRHRSRHQASGNRRTTRGSWA